MRFPGVPSDPLAFWQQLHPHPTHSFFLGSGANSASDHLLFCSAAEPARVWRCAPAQVSRLLNQINSSFKSGAAVPRFVGFFGFEAGRSFDRGIARLPRRPDPLATPAALFGDYRAVVKIDLKKRETVLYFNGPSRGRKKIEEKFLRLMQAGDLKSSTLTRPRKAEGKFHFASERDFSRMVLKAKEHIAAGDIYQANLSIRFSGRYQHSPVRLYRALCAKNPSPYACLLKFGPDWIVSNSPELLVKSENSRLVTRPIAGTRPRGKTSSQDSRRRGQLLLSPKERAEHIMLVDLERNDLGRVCRPGTVRVTERFAVERYSHVMHIVSQVEGRLAGGKKSVDAVRALFPGGTITGCPKIKSIEVIEQLEKKSRGPFYGSAGFFCNNGDATFNILIRTALVRRGRIFVQAGAGIVADSHPAREYKEVWAKAGALLEAAGGTT